MISVSREMTTDKGIDAVHIRRRYKGRGQQRRVKRKSKRTSDKSEHTQDHGLIKRKA